MHIVKRDRSANDGRPEYQFQFFCKLFEDMVSPELCFARRNHFDGHNVFSCSGCNKDSILNSPRNCTGSSEPAL